MTIDFLKSRFNNLDPIILLHGWGMSASVFQSLEKKLSGCRQTICVDLPGYEGNPWQAGLSFEDQAASIAARLPGGILIGWSMGGLYATEIARQNAQKCKIVIVSLFIQT